MSMMIRGIHWYVVLEKLTREEKIHLDNSITAEAFRPHNIIIDERKLSPELLSKVKNALGIKPESTTGNPGVI